MQKDSLTYDSLNNRPLPKWLTDQKSGLTIAQPKKVVMKEDKSLNLSFAITGTFILLVVAILSLYILRKHKNQSL
jgi:heme/copper-type cytochrome/quinol oxidase subunit 2